jgi:hypothetical protein
MKLICEDMRGILIQITKGNLDNGKLSLDDLNSKLEETISKLKKECKKEYDSAENAAGLKNATLVSCQTWYSYTIIFASWQINIANLPNLPIFFFLVRFVKTRVESIQSNEWRTCGT